MGYWLIILCVVFEISLELCFKLAANHAKEADDEFIVALKQPIAWLGIMLWLMETICWLYALHQVPLHIAFPFISLTYIGIPLASALFLKEKLNKKHIIASVLITAGVIIIARG